MSVKCVDGTLNIKQCEASYLKTANLPTAMLPTTTVRQVLDAVAAINTVSRVSGDNQDYFAKFVSEKIRPWVYNDNNPQKTESKISKTNIQNEFKEWWKREYNTSFRIKRQELINYLNIKLGRYKNRGWWGYEIIYDGYDSE